jgi:hypothetical protein
VTPDPTLEVPDLLRRAGESQAASEQLFAMLYAELRRLAESQLCRHGGHFTLGATTLVHEAYLSMVGRKDAAFPDRARFFAYASQGRDALAANRSG